MLTLPAAATVGGAVYGVTRLFGNGAAGPVIVAVVGIAFTIGVFVRRLQQGPAVSTAEGA